MKRQYVRQSSSARTTRLQANYLTCLLHFVVVTFRSIVRDFEDCNSSDQPNRSWNDADRPPGLFSGHAGLEERKEHGSHYELRHTAAEVSPSTHERIGGTDNFLGEHARRPELTHDERRSTKTDEETEDSEGGGAVHETSQRAGNGSEGENNA